MPHLTTPRGLNWHYDLEGDGEALLFIHGFGVSSKIWRSQVEHFSTGFKVLTVDLPGHGESGWQDVNLVDMAVDLNFILGNLGIHQVNVIGSSFGGLIGLYLLKTGSEKVQRISFVGSLPKFAKTKDYPAGLDIDRIRKLSSQFEGGYETILEIFFRSLFSRRDRESERFKWIKQFQKNDALPRREALQKFLDILEKEDARDILASVNCRVQFLNGTEDYIVPVESMKWMEEHLPWANFDYFEGAGHFPFLIKPKEFNELLEGFLTS